MKKAPRFTRVVPGEARGGRSVGGRGARRCPRPILLPSMRFLFAALLLAGCLPDLGGYAVGERRDAGPRPDVGPGVDGGGAGVDGSLRSLQLW